MRDLKKYYDEVTLLLPNVLHLLDLLHYCVINLVFECITFINVLHLLVHCQMKCYLFLNFVSKTHWKKIEKQPTFRNKFNKYNY